MPRQTDTCTGHTSEPLSMVRFDHSGKIPNIFPARAWDGLRGQSSGPAIVRAPVAWTKTAAASMPPKGNVIPRSTDRKMLPDVNGNGLPPCANHTINSKRNDALRMTAGGLGGMQIAFVKADVDITDLGADGEARDARCTAWKCPSLLQGRLEVDC